MAHQVFDNQGRHIPLGSELGRGGEGAVYDIRGDTPYVAKLYLKPLDHEKAQKLSLMVGLGAKSLSQFAAWPVATLHSKNNGSTIGIVMPKIRKPTEIHDLYGPMSRRIHFPLADWRFLVRVAFNCAAAFKSLHDKQIVIGDVNQGNVLVATDGTVNLIDCDSFQISGQGRKFLCKVGVDHFTPPELKSYSHERTANHDNFGLAVLIFHLLFMGRHPFMGRYSGHGDMPLEKAVKDNRFAYGTHAPKFQMTPPPGSLSLDEASPEIASFFEGAFADPRSGRLRPSAGQWINALMKLEGAFAKCNRDPGHFHFKGVNCPWCRIVKQGGKNLFISVSLKTAAAATAKFNLDKTWYEIRAVKKPTDGLNRHVRANTSSLTPRPLVMGPDHSKAPRMLLAGILTVSLLMTMLSLLYPIIAPFSIPVALVSSVWWYVLWLSRPKKKEVRLRKTNLANVQSELKNAKSNLSKVVEIKRSSFDSKFEELHHAWLRYGNLDVLRDEEYKKLQASAKKRQLEDHLEHCFIRPHQISRIGHSRAVTLQSYGIETAADITRERVEAVPGFGPVYADALVNWRRTQEATFRYNPSKGAPASAVQALDMKFLQERTQIQASLSSGAGELKNITNSANAELGRLDERLAQLELALAQAQLDATVTE